MRISEIEFIIAEPSSLADLCKVELKPNFRLCWTDEETESLEVYVLFAATFWKVLKVCHL